MDRSNFLKILSAGAGSLFIKGLNVDSDSLQYDLKKIKIYDNYVRGVNFRKNDFFEAKLSIGDIVQLVREPDNAHDRFAVKVEKKGMFLGYIAAYENIVLAMLLDQGVHLEASVSNLKENIQKDKYLDQVFSVQVSAKLLVPVHHLQATDLATKRADDIEDIYRM